MITELEAATLARYRLDGQSAYIVLLDKQGKQIGTRIRCSIKVTDEPTTKLGLVVFRTGQVFLHITPDEGEPRIVWPGPDGFVESLHFVVEREDCTALLTGPVRLRHVLTVGSTIWPDITVPLEDFCESK